MIGATPPNDAAPGAPDPTPANSSPTSNRGRPGLVCKVRKCAGELVKADPPEWAGRPLPGDREDWYPCPKCGRVYVIRTNMLGERRPLCRVYPPQPDSADFGRRYAEQLAAGEPIPSAAQIMAEQGLTLRTARRWRANLARYGTAHKPTNWRRSDAGAWVLPKLRSAARLAVHYSRGIEARDCRDLAEVVAWLTDTLARWRQVDGCSGPEAEPVDLYPRPPLNETWLCRRPDAEQAGG